MYDWDTKRWNGSTIGGHTRRAWTVRLLWNSYTAQRELRIWSESMTGEKELEE